MKKTLQFALSLFLLFLIFSVSASKTNDSKQILTVKYIINAVNDQNAENYADPFAENTKIYVDGDLKIKGKKSLKLNRESHFKQYPKIRSEIQYLVEIDNKVIMHDKVWLTDSEEIGRDIVEIFTFDNGEISKVDVIQPTNLFE